MPESVGIANSGRGQTIVRMIKYAKNHTGLGIIQAPTKGGIWLS